MEKNRVANQYKRWLVSRVLSLIANCPIFYDKKLSEVELTFDSIKKRIILDDVSFAEEPEIFLRKIGIDFVKDLSVLEREKITTIVSQLKLAGNSNSAIRSICAMAGNMANSFYFY